MTSTWRVSGVLLILAVGTAATLGSIERPDLAPLWPLLTSVAACGIAIAIWWRWRWTALPFLFALGAVALFPWVADWYSDQIPRPLNLFPALACLALWLLAIGWTFIPGDEDFRADAERSRPPVIGIRGAGWRERFLPEPRPRLWKIALVIAGLPVAAFESTTGLLKPFFDWFVPALWPGHPQFVARLSPDGQEAVLWLPAILCWIVMSLVVAAALLQWSGGLWLTALVLTLAILAASLLLNPFLLPSAALPILLATRLESFVNEGLEKG